LACSGIDALPSYRAITCIIDKVRR
jgi:hypothetical protein